MTELYSVVAYIGAAHISFTIFAAVYAWGSDELIQNYWDANGDDYSGVSAILEYLGLVLLFPVVIQLTVLEKAAEREGDLIG